MFNGEGVITPLSTSLLHTWYNIGYERPADKLLSYLQVVIQTLLFF